MKNTEQKAAFYQELLDLQRSGMTYKEIAKKYDVSETAIRYHFGRSSAARQAQEEIRREIVRKAAEIEIPRTICIVAVYDKTGTTATIAEIKDRGIYSSVEQHCDYGGVVSPRDLPGQISSGRPVLVSALNAAGFRCLETCRVEGVPYLADGRGHFGEVDALPAIHIDKEVCLTLEPSGRLDARLCQEEFEVSVTREKGGIAGIHCPSINLAGTDERYVCFLTAASKVSAALNIAIMPPVEKNISVKMTPSEGLVLVCPAHSSAEISAILRLIDILADLAGMTREDLVSTAKTGSGLAEVMAEAKVTTATSGCFDSPVASVTDRPKSSCRCGF